MRRSRRRYYLAFAQDENPSSLVVYARTTGDPKTVFASLRREVNGLDPALPITGLRTMEDQIDESLSAQRAMAGLSAFFGILATLLAAIGLYGVMAYTVTRRTREIGIRLALGAGRASLLKLVLREVALLTVAGVAIAIPVALAITRLVRSELYGIVPNDPLSICRGRQSCWHRWPCSRDTSRPNAPPESTPSPPCATSRTDDAFGRLSLLA